MPRKFKKSKRKNLHEIGEWQRVLLAFGPAGVSHMHLENRFDLMVTRANQWMTWWSVSREEILATWQDMFPGSLPWAWWEFEAPRWDDSRFSAWSFRLPAPRLKIGGSGVYRHDRQAYLPVHASGRYALIDVDSTNPPVFESEIEYIRRHELA